MIEVIRFPTPLLKSNMYLICENGCGIIIDPYSDPDYCAQIEEQVRKVDYIILTHEHYDHISGTNELRARFHSPVLCGAVCGRRIQNVKDNVARYFGAYASLQTAEPMVNERLLKEDFTTSADETFTGTYALSWQGHRFDLAETPGHSPGSICVLLDGTSLFSGDSLLPDVEAVIRFPESNKQQYEERALPFLRSLLPETDVYPGHYKPFRLGDHPSITTG